MLMFTYTHSVPTANDSLPCNDLDVLPISLVLHFSLQICGRFVRIHLISALVFIEDRLL